MEVILQPQDNDLMGDIQKLYFARVIAQEVKQIPHALARLEALCESLGVGPAVADYEQLLHNGGNDTIWELEALLTGLLLTDSQMSELGKRPLRRLDKNWNDFNLQLNQQQKPPFL